MRGVQDDRQIRAAAPALSHLGGWRERGRSRQRHAKPSLGIGIGMGYVPPEFAKPDTKIEIEIRGKRFAAVVVSNRSSGRVSPRWPRQPACSFVRMPPPGAGKQSGGDEEEQKPVCHFAALENQDKKNNPDQPGSSRRQVMQAEAAKKIFDLIEIHIFKGVVQAMIGKLPGDRS